MGQQPVSFAPIRFKFFSSKVSGNDHRCPTCCCPPSSHLFIFSKRVFTKSVGWYKPSQLKCDKTSVFLKFWQEFKKKGKLSENVFTPPLSLSSSPVCTVDWPVIVYLLSRPPPPSIIPPPDDWYLIRRRRYWPQLFLSWPCLDSRWMSPFSIFF